MSEQILLGELVNRQNSINKPGTACLGCRRRKLKCLREPEGCHNCSKSGLQCVYPTPEAGLKRKRGPYKKDKTPRERHLEDLVKYLKPEASRPGNVTGSSDQSSPYESHTPGLGRSTSAPSAAQAANSEALVADALIALTRSSVADQDARIDSLPSILHHKYISSGVHGPAAAQHPDTRKILEYWHLFVSRVDPMVKIIHCPTFAEKLFGVIDNIGNVGPSTNALLLSVYYTAVSTCTAAEARRRFGESQEELMQRYGRYFESAIRHSFDAPTLEALQALVLYMIPNKRHDSGSIKHFFQLALRSAQMIRLHEDPGFTVPPLQAELRRRLWYHLCGLESRTAEESRSRQPSILHNHNVQIPANLDDRDLTAGMSRMPRPRRGVTEMTFPILRFEIHCLVFGLLSTKKKWATFDSPEATTRMRAEQVDFFELTERRLYNDSMQHLEPSRPHDWMCIQFMKAMLIKARLVIDFPSGTVPSKTMPLNDRMYLLQASVDIIQLTHVLAVDDRLSDSQWYFRDFVQWHCLAVIVAELGWNTNESFCQSAWVVLDPMLQDWDVVYGSKRDEPAWDYVNVLIERARSLRRQTRPRAARRDTGNYSESTPEDKLLNRAGFTKPSTTTVCPIRSENASGDAVYAVPASQYQRHEQEIGSQQQKPIHFQQTPISQYRISENHGAGTYAFTGPPCSFDLSSGNGFDDINFSAFNEVFNSASWTQFIPPENSVPKKYELISHTSGYSMAPPE